MLSLASYILSLLKFELNDEMNDACTQNKNEAWMLTNRCPITLKYLFVIIFCIFSVLGYAVQKSGSSCWGQNKQWNRVAEQRFETQSV